MLVRMTFGYLPIFAAIFLAVGTANAVTMTIGDVDGFGFTSPNDYEDAQDGNPDRDGDGIIEDGEYLPDLDNDGNVHVTRNDEFDNRSTDERNSTNGAQWTDISLEDYYDYPGDGAFGDAPADDALFTFAFDVPTLGDDDYGVDHFINFIFGDYDVSPAYLYVDGSSIDLTTQPGGEDGLVQLAYANVAWSDMIDGEVVIDLDAPYEPYVAIDYAYLHTENEAAPNPVPEPSVLALLATGLLGLGFSMRRCRS